MKNVCGNFSREEPYFHDSNYGFIKSQTLDKGLGSKYICLFLCLMVLNATFNNISDISWRLVLLVEETRGPGENHRPVASH